MRKKTRKTDRTIFHRSFVFILLLLGIFLSNLSIGWMADIGKDLVTAVVIIYAIRPKMPIWASTQQYWTGRDYLQSYFFTGLIIFIMRMLAHQHPDHFP